MYAAFPKQKARRDNRPTWTLSFADLMMLLLTFFILLLSMSDMNEEKYQQVASSFHDKGGDTALLQRPDNLIPANTIQRSTTTGVADFELALADEIENDLVQIVRKDGSIVIRIQERIAFSSASEHLDESFLPVLRKVSTILQQVPGNITVSGHTDDRPIATDRFRSNWDLSSARAVSVIHALMANSRIPATQFSAVGFADTRPFVPNDTSEHRAMNRRVEIRVDLRENEYGKESEQRSPPWIVP